MSDVSTILEKVTFDDFKKYLETAEEICTEEEFLENYTRWGYKYINSFLRTGVLSGDEMYLKLSIMAMDNLFLEAKTLDENTLVYRGVPNFTGFKDGEYIEKGYLSTTKNKSVAYTFKKDVACCILEIIAEKGLPFILGDPTEYELIFPRNLTLKLLEDKGGVKRVSLSMRDDYVSPMRVDFFDFEEGIVKSLLKDIPPENRKYYPLNYLKNDLVVPALKSGMRRQIGALKKRFIERGDIESLEKIQSFGIPFTERDLFHAFSGFLYGIIHYLLQFVRVSDNLIKELIEKNIFDRHFLVYVPKYISEEQYDRLYQNTYDEDTYEDYGDKYDY